MSHTIGKQFAFEAAHQLHGLPDGHKCARLHGHSYTVEVVVSAEHLGGPGFVVDFAELDPVKRHIAATWDHRALNEILDAEPTSENLAQALFEWCVTNVTLPPGASFTAVRVSETASSWAEYRPRR